MLGVEAKLLLEGCPLAAIVLDPSGRVAFGNQHACELFGLGIAFVGTPISDLIPAWPPHDPSRAILQVMRRGQRTSCRVETSACLGPNGPMTGVWFWPMEQGSVAQAAVSEAEVRLRFIIEMLPQAVCVFDADDRYVLWNHRYAELYAEIADHLTPGVRFEDILQLSLASGSIQEVIHDPDAWLEQRMARFRRDRSQEEHQLRDGRWLRYDDRRTPEGGAIGLRIDITELKRREEWLRQLFQANPMPMLLCDGRDLSILDANRAAVDFYGFEAADLLGRSPGDMHVDDQRQEFASKAMGPDGDHEPRRVWRQRMADGRERHVLVYVRSLQNPAGRHLLLTVADVTERVLAEVEATRLANHDVLTGLPNRLRFYRALDDALREQTGDRVVVYCLDLDGFKPVNDVFGHAVGDEVLRMVAERLRSETEGHMVARLGGDEFAILATSGGEPDASLAERCIRAFRQPFVVRDLPITLGISIGFAAAVAGADAEALLKEADRVLYQAKAAGRNTWRAAPSDESAGEAARLSEVTVSGTTCQGPGASTSRSRRSSRSVPADAIACEERRGRHATGSV